VTLAWEEAIRRIRHTDTVRVTGSVTDIVGLSVEVRGLADPVGSVCRIERGRSAEPVLAEIIGYRDGRAVVMPYQSVSGIAPGQRVSVLQRHLRVPADDALLGRVVNGIGRPQDGGPPLRNVRWRSVAGAPPRPLERRRCAEMFATGVRAVDGLVTVAAGQRMGIFAGSGVGKSVLLGMLARHAVADVNVIALIGERGREVREFIERDLGPEGMARSVVVAVTSDENAVMRVKGAETAMALAEHFRDQGRNVLLLMDSVTRYAMALREIGLAAGEPPTTKGYPPSVFSHLPKLCERAGWSDRAAITAFFTVLIEGDDIHDPVGDAVRSILDGHVMLSRDLAREGHYPAIDVLGSVSRLRNDIVDDRLREAGTRLLRWLKAYEENRDLINIGAYVAGSDPLVDQALARREAIREFLVQDFRQGSPWEETARRLLQLTDTA